LEAPFSPDGASVAVAADENSYRYAPYIPVDIMVPKSRSEEAGAILHSMLGSPPVESKPAVP
jgi:hypothetical protein